jgi:hypothetical protein
VFSRRIDSEVGRGMTTRLPGTHALRWNGFTAFVLIAGFALFSAGCAKGLHPRLTLAGQAVDWATFRALQAGASESEVVAAIGTASAVRSEGDETVWSYYERAQLRGCTTTFLFVSIGGPPIMEYKGEVRFRDGVVTHVAVHERHSRDRSVTTEHP